MSIYVATNSFDLGGVRMNYDEIKYFLEEAGWSHIYTLDNGIDVPKVHIFAKPNMCTCIEVTYYEGIIYPQSVIDTIVKKACRTE